MAALVTLTGLPQPFPAVAALFPGPVASSVASLDSWDSASIRLGGLEAPRAEGSLLPSWLSLISFLALSDWTSHILFWELWDPAVPSARSSGDKALVSFRVTLLMVWMRLEQE